MFRPLWCTTLPFIAVYRRDASNDGFPSRFLHYLIADGWPQCKLNSNNLRCCSVLYSKQRFLISEQQSFSVDACLWNNQYENENFIIFWAAIVTLILNAYS